MNGPDVSELTIREPSPSEVIRALHLFRAAPLPRQARLFVAVKTRPVERFVAAAAWWVVVDRFCFRLAVQPGSSARVAACGQLIERIAECGRALKFGSIHYSDLIADDNEWVPLLRENRFVISHSERFFEVSAQESWTRTMEIAERMHDKFPRTWRTESIRFHQCDTILNVIDPFHLMPLDEVRDRWRDDCPDGFELDLSGILFDDTRPVGAFLMRRKMDTLSVDVRVVQTGKRLLNSLGNVALLHHTAVKSGPTYKGIKRLQFRGGEIEHRETANLALRMGGIELPSRHIYAKTL